MTIAHTPEIITIETPTLGNRSYLTHDGTVAFVIDPQRDIDRVLAAADEAGVRITHVFETHIHNDYLTGGLALAEVTGARYHVNGADPVSFERTPIGDGDVVEVSPAMHVTAIATPGHTYTHLSYALSTPSEPGSGSSADLAADSAPDRAGTTAVFTGGSLLFGATGRPDLLGAAHTHDLVHHQHASARRLAELPDYTAVLPTHGFGSFCSSGSTTDVSASTIGAEKKHNPALSQEAQEWAAATLEGLDAYPAYYAHMGPGNSSGPSAADLAVPEPADRTTLARRIEAGEWVVDLRSRTAYAAGHVVGTLNIGLDGQFATYLGWLIPWGTAVTLLGETAEEVAKAQRELVRIGVDNLAGAATGTPHDWTNGPLGSYQLATFADLVEVRHHRPVTVLDVRRDKEHAASHIVGAFSMPLHSLLERLDEVPDGEVWVHCASGYRSSIAASILAGRAIPVVSIDDDFNRSAAAAGLPVASA